MRLRSYGRMGSLMLAAVSVMTLLGAARCGAPQAAPNGSPTGAPATSRQGGGVAAGGTGTAPSTRPPASRRSVPPAPASPSPSRRSTAPTPRVSSPPPASPKPYYCPAGEYQRAVEQYLAQLRIFGPVVVDGQQSATDCRTIQNFQRRFGIYPAEGRPGPTTVDVARRIANTRPADCQAGSGTTVCVNLTLQTMWVMRGGAVVLGPTVTRTGMAGYATPAGWFSVFHKDVREWSVPYSVWMPYWQGFYDGMGLHQTTTYIHDMSIGSHGCVNLLPSDAAALWGLTVVGTPVHIFGRRPGT